MRKSKADPLNPPIEDLQGQVYQHELGDPDRSRQIDRVLDEWGRKATARKRARRKKKPATLLRKTEKKSLIPQTHKHLLIVTDTSKASERALAYVAELMAGGQDKDIRVSLLHVPKPVPPRLLEFGGSEDPAVEKTAEDALQSARKDWIDREQMAAAPMFKRARARLREAGVPEAAVDTQIADWNPNEDFDSAILEVAHEKHCGTVVIGCAGSSSFQLQKETGIVIWTVR